MTATAGALAQATDRAQRQLAADAIERDHRTGESGAMVREQLKRVFPELRKQFGIQSRRAFDRIVLPGGHVLTLDEKYLAPDEQILQRPQGQASLKRYLDDKLLVYQDSDALDPRKLLKDVLPGAVPASGRADTWSARGA